MSENIGATAGGGGDVPEYLREANVVRVQPGDVIIYRTDHHLTMVEAALVRQQMREVWPHNECIAISGGSFEVFRPVPGGNPVPPLVLARVREMLENGQKIRAIKAIREAAAGLGLREAKEYAESLPEWDAYARAVAAEKTGASS